MSHTCECKGGDSLGILVNRDNSRELSRKSTRGILVLYIEGLLGLRDERLGACVDWCGDSVTPKGQANPKGSKELRVEL